MAVKSFEELIAWQKARAMNRKVYSVFGKQKEFYYRDQICSAALSTMNNIAEGFERKSNAEFKNFLNYAKGSCGEVRSMLYVALDFGFIAQEEFNNFAEEVRDVSRLIYRLRESL